MTCEDKIIVKYYHLQPAPAIGQDRCSYYLHPPVAFHDAPIAFFFVSSVWEKQFPTVIDSLLKAAEATGAVLVWVDNLYMFGPEAAVSGIPMKVTTFFADLHRRGTSLRPL